VDVDHRVLSAVHDELRKGPSGRLAGYRVCGEALSPTLTSRIGFLNPSAIVTSVAPVKPLTLQVLAAEARLPVSSAAEAPPTNSTGTVDLFADLTGYFY
jgi:hypothetical protein